MKKRMATNDVFFLGVLALVLRRQQQLTAMDEKGLFVKMHPMNLALLALSAAAMLLICFAVRKQYESASFEERSPRGVLAALGHAVMAGGILSTILAGGPRAINYLAAAWRWLGFASALCMILAGTDRLRGRKSNFLLHVVPCLFLAVHIVSHYQSWSGNPQMQNYVFAMLGAMALLFFSFYTAAMEAGCGSRRMLLGMGLAAIYLCLAETASSAYTRLYLAGIFWVMTELYCVEATVSAEKE